MKKKILLTVMVIMLSLIVFGAISASAASLSYTVSDGKATITDCPTSESGSLIIPSTLGGYPVTAIGEYAFFDCDKITSISIPNGVTSIGEKAFHYCKKLASIYIPDSVTYIDSDAFWYCDSLGSITVSPGNTHYTSENNVLFNRDKTTLILYSPKKTNSTYAVPDTATRIERGAFYFCANLTNITIPSSVTTIGHHAFSDCINLTDVNISHGVTTIDWAAFAYCNSLTSITIPGSVTRMGDAVFPYCLKDVYYNGTADNWNTILSGTSNGALNEATIHYFAYVTLLDKNENKISNKTQNMGDFVDTSTVDIPEGYALILYRNKELTEVYDIKTPITENLTLYVDFMKLNTLEFEGATIVDIGEHGITQKISFVTDKDAKYFSCTLKVPNSLTVQEIKSDIFELEQDYEVIGNYTYYYLFLIYNGDENIPASQKTIPFEVVFDVSENAVANEILTVEILDDAILADDNGNTYEFANIEKSEIKINPIFAEEITIVGADEIDKPTQYTVSVLPENTTNPNVEWSVSDEAIATISEDGILTPVKKGTVTVRATAKDGSDVYTEKIVSVKVLGTVNSITTNIGLWDIEYSEQNTNYTIYVPKTATSIRISAKHNGTLKTDKTTFVNNVARTVTLSTTSDETVLDLTYTCNGYDDNKYTITVVKFEGTKTEVSENKKSFTITPINIENGKTVILALYNGKQFVEMQKTIYEGDDIPFTTTKTYTNAKVFVWNDLETLIPVCEAEEIPLN